MALRCPRTEWVRIPSRLDNIFLKELQGSRYLQQPLWPRLLKVRECQWMASKTILTMTPIIAIAR
jgi:hypothetical protein